MITKTLSLTGKIDIEVTINEVLNFLNTREWLETATLSLVH